MFPKFCSPPRVIHTNDTLALYDSYQGWFEGSPIFTFDFTVVYGNSHWQNLFLYQQDFYINYTQFLISHTIQLLLSEICCKRNTEYSVIRTGQKRWPAPFIYLYTDISQAAQDKAASSIRLVERKGIFLVRQRSLWPPS